MLTTTHTFSHQAQYLLHMSLIFIDNKHPVYQLNTMAASGIQYSSKFSNLVFSLPVRIQSHISVISQRPSLTPRTSRRKDRKSPLIFVRKDMGIKFYSNLGLSCDPFIGIYKWIIYHYQNKSNLWIY